MQQREEEVLVVQTDLQKVIHTMFQIKSLLVPSYISQNRTPIYWLLFRYDALYANKVWFAGTDLVWRRDQWQLTCKRKKLSSMQYIHTPHLACSRVIKLQSYHDINYYYTRTYWSRLVVTTMASASRLYYLLRKAKLASPHFYKVQQRNRVVK